MKRTYLWKTTIFTVLAIVMLICASDILLLKKVTVDDTANTYIQKGIYELEDDSIDVCFLGNSQVVYGISSMQLLEEYGISAYSASTSLQPFSLNLFNLKELQKTQNIKTVVLDMGAIDRNISDARQRMVLDNSPMSMNKLQTIWEYCQTKSASDIWTYIFPIMKYHGRWDELSEEDFNYRTTNTHVFRGNILSSDVKMLDYDALIADDDEEINPNAKIRDYQVESFRQIAEYCKENNIELLLIKTPKLDWDKAKMLKSQELADEYGLEYLDFNTAALLNETGISVDTDFKDSDHLNTYGTRKLTNYLGQYLLEHGAYEDYREKELYDEEEMKAYHMDLNRNLLCLAKTPEEALKIMTEDDNYEVFMKTSADVSAYWTEELQESMEKLGLCQGIGELTGSNFVAYLSGGESIYEMNNMEAISVKEKMTEDRGEYSITSNLADTWSEVSLTVAGQEQIFAMRGLNITVYHKEYKEVVRSFTIYYDQETGMLRLY